MHSNQCWSCKDARVACDYAQPSCARCSKSGRDCQYGLRLSWPKANNKKRSLTVAVRGDDKSKLKSPVAQTSFVNTTPWDIQVHHYLRMNQGFGGFGDDGDYVVPRLHLPLALSWLPVQLTGGERELMDHFVSTAHSLLAVFAPDPSDLTGLLVRLALSDNSTSSTAVLHAALALAALHKYGAQTDIYAFKDRALQTLLGSCSPDNAANKGMVAQHMAASMLLCHLEMLGLPNTVPLWFCHLRHAKTLIDNVVVGVHDAVSFDSEFPGLVGWVEYHTVLARFSIRHWYRYEGEARKGVKTSTVAVAEQGGCQPKKTKDVAHGAHEIVQLMGFLFGTLLSSTDEHFHDEEYEQTLRCLENRISHLETGGVDNKSWSATVELLKLSALIYLKRASRNFSGTSSEIDALVERAHCLLDDVKQAPAFTLLIIGCEARSDEQRKKMLKYAERARKMSSLRSIQQVRDILQKVWIQDDLAVDDYELDYIGRLDTGITSFKMMPSFA